MFELQWWMFCLHFFYWFRVLLFYHLVTTPCHLSNCFTFKRYLELHLLHNAITLSLALPTEKETVKIIVEHNKVLSHFVALQFYFHRWRWNLCWASLLFSIWVLFASIFPLKIVPVLVSVSVDWCFTIGNVDWMCPLDH